MNLNFSGFINTLRLFTKPSLCLPHATVPTFADLPVPLESALKLGNNGEKANIKAVVLDKDDCFAYPEKNEIHPSNRARFRQLQKEFPGQKLLIVSNTAGATSHDRNGQQAVELSSATGGVPVLTHRTKKPGCGDEIMDHFRKHPDAGVTHPNQIVVVGDRLATDVMLANLMGARSIWVREGVAPFGEKSVFVKFERRLADFLLRRGFRTPTPRSSP